MTRIPRAARVVDVGGGAAPFARADHVVDAVAWEDRGSGSDGARGTAPGLSREQWTQVDLCDRRPWPFADKSFDFAVCSHVLEDVRDPLWVCSELSRIARAGYIEMPSRVLEQSRGVENPLYAGYCHHRWLVCRRAGVLEFRHKPHLLHAVDDAIVANLSAGRRINPRYAFVALDWEGHINAREVLEFNESAIVSELCEYANRARGLPGLSEPLAMPLHRRLRRHVLFHRLSQGRRIA